MSHQIQGYETEQGARIYRIPLNLFPRLDGYAHVVLFDQFRVLFDVGSGFGSSNEQLEAGLTEISRQFGEDVCWSDISHIVVSHGHIDHFGGLSFVREKCQAPVIIHSLDRRVLSHYEARLTLVARHLKSYLRESGLPPDRIEGVMAMYMLNKGLFQSQPVDLTCEELGMRLGRMRWIHVPGHCPGQIVAQIDEVLLTADHVLETTSPHQAPECLTLTTGLSHYLDSLAALRPLAEEFKLALGGHEGPVHDLDRRIIEIAEVHHGRLIEILQLTDHAKTVDEIAQLLFPHVEGYHQLLALEETGAHVEYLHQRGLLTVANYADLELSELEPVRYKRTESDYREQLRTSLTAFEPVLTAKEHTTKPV